MHARDRRATLPARAPRRRRHGSRGASSVEYGLIVALIGAVLCIGIGIGLKGLFQNTIHCFTVGLQGSSDPSCSQAPSGGGGGGSGGGGGGGGTIPVSPTPTVTPTPTATPPGP